MFIRFSRVTRRDGRTYEYPQLVESYRREDGRPVHRVIASLNGCSPLEIRNLETMLEASRRGQSVVVARHKKSEPSGSRAPKPTANLDFLDIAVLLALWHKWELDQLFRQLMPKGEANVSGADVVTALVLHRCVDPDSKLAATRWFGRSALPELTGIAPNQFNNTRLHRVLDDLEAVTPALMGKLPSLYRRQKGAFAALFLDVSDTWFVGRGPAAAERAKTKEGLQARKIGIVLLCNEHGYPLRWDVIPGRQSDSSSMTEMLQGLSQLNWVRDTPVVVDRAMGKTAHIRDMLAMNVRFLTALGVTEFSAYANALPYQSIAALADPDQHTEDAVFAEQAGAQAAAAGMTPVADDLYVMDFGMVDRAMMQPQDDPSELDNVAADDDVDPLGGIMRLVRRINDAIRDGRYSSYAAAGAALGLKKGVFAKYRELNKLPESIQHAIIDGQASGHSLAQLIRIARLQHVEEQYKAFEALIATPTSPQRRPPLATQSQRTDDDDVDVDAVRVRVVAYFNPDRFVQKRRVAIKRIADIQAFVDELNRGLANPRSTRTRDQIMASVDRRLRRDNLIEAFHVEVVEQHIATKSRYQVKLQLDTAEWQRRRRYDGFSVLVAHPQSKATGPELCHLYRAKDTVEKDFQTIKSVVELRPVRHRTDEKVRAHVTLCVLALLLERILDDTLKASAQRSTKSRRRRAKVSAATTARVALEALKPVKLNLYRTDDTPAVYTITELDQEQRELLESLGLTHLADDDHLAERITPR